MSKKVKRVFLVRHGQSQSNVDPSKNKKIPDHMIELTSEGRKQAKAAGLFLDSYIRENLGEQGWFTQLFAPKHHVNYPYIRMWNSPYTRARQTASEIWNYCKLINDNKEHLLLAEQRFGVFDGLSDDERREAFPAFQAHYEKVRNQGGKMWPKMPGGDSRFDVCQRVHQAFGTFHRDAEENNIENIIVVGHGTTNRAFTLMWFNYTYEWMHKEANPKNCSIRLFEEGKDKGYIFDGFD